MHDAIEREIHDLHNFFVEWFAGTLPDTPDAWAAAPAVMAPDFELVSPDGQLTGREPLLTMLRAAHGVKPLRIWIENLRSRPLGDGLWLATYHECQQIEDRSTRRQSSAVMREAPEARHGIVWVHVHETWLEA